MTARLIDSRELAPGVRHFEFDVPEVDHFDFAAGQFVSLSAQVGDKLITRAYSLASKPAANRFELCLNIVEDGKFSPNLFAMKPGDRVDLAGPIGYFVWRRPVNDSILVATGTGIAPFRGMLQDLYSNAAIARPTVHLIFGVRYEAHLLYRDEFEGMERQQPGFEFRPVLSRPDGNWRGRQGHVQPHVLEALGERRDVDVYICGLKAMVDDLRAQLKAAGLDRKRIIYEKYD
jgi:NAD(P)H-flavin reductase